MLLKRADDKESQLTVLRNLIAHEKIPPHKKPQIETELRNVQTGLATEKQAAYEIDFYFGQSKNIQVIHDLRIEINGRVAQIDHLLINRGLEVYVLETKTFNSGLTINERGEFSTMAEGKMIGIPSPVEQNARHIAVLQDAFKEIGMPTRFGIPFSPTFYSVILVSPKAIINRPPSDTFDATVIKLDQFFSWYDRKLRSVVLSDYLNLLKLKVVRKEAVGQLGERLCSLHKGGRIDYVRKFSLGEDLISETSTPLRKTTAYANSQVETRAATSEVSFSCARCNIKIAEVVAKFCLVRTARFAGKTYCRSCQSDF